LLWHQSSVQKATTLPTPSRLSAPRSESIPESLV